MKTAILMSAYFNIAGFSLIFIRIGMDVFIGSLYDLYLLKTVR